MYSEQIGTSGIYAFKIESKLDARGEFRKIKDSQTSCSDNKVNEISIVTNSYPNTLRGIHFQKKPFRETKLIACLEGEIFDVLVDLRTIESKSPKIYSVWLGSEHEFQAIQVPSHFGHGYLSTSERSLILYGMDMPYSSDHASGLKWDDPHLGIDWPKRPEVVSDRDQQWEYFKWDQTYE